MNRLMAMLFAALLSVGCATPQAGSPPAGAQSEEQLVMIQMRRLEINEMQEQVRLLHKNLMIVGKTDAKYGAKLKEAWRMPPSEAALSALPSSLPALSLIKSQLEMKLKRYRDLLVIGNAGY